jgi:hydrogenase maturation factor
MTTVDPNRCITCSDVAVEATVLEVSGDTAKVAVADRREQVGVELVAPVEVGDVLLCQAGIALQKVAP